MNYNEYLDKSYMKLSDNMEVCREPFNRLEQERVTNKEVLNKVLGLTEENNYRVILNESLTETQFKRGFPNTVKFIEFIIGDVKYSITKNKVYTGKNTYLKLSKQITKFFDQLNSGWEYTSSVDKSLYFDSIKELGINSTNYECYVSSLIDSVKPKNICISTNIYDMLTSSTDSSYSSCYNMSSGEFFNGNLAYIRDSFTVITFVYGDDIHRKVGRSWAYIFPDKFKLALPGKPYGSIYSMEYRIIRKYIERSISDWNGVKPYWKVDKKLYYEDHMYSHGKCTVYFDHGNVMVAYDKRQTDSEPPFLEFALARCLVCGDVTDNPERGCCRYCDDGGNWCECCQSSFTGVEYSHPGGGQLCADCYVEYFKTCEDCGDIHNADYSYYVEGHGYICEYCYSRNYSNCVDCNEIYHQNDLHYIYSEDHYVCNCCLDNYSTCDDCNKFFDREELVQHEIEYLCPECYDYVTESVET